jgi:uncharacterized protein (TIGR00725 family)
MTVGPEVRVGVFGHGIRGTAHVGPATEEWAEAFGCAVATAGATLLTGGGGGIAEFCRRGASRIGGRIVSIHPAGRIEPSDALHKMLGTTIATGQGKVGRVPTLIQSIDLGFSLGGGAGTLLEVVTGYLLGVPVVVVEGLGLSDDPDPILLVHETSDGDFQGVRFRKGFFDGKDRDLVRAPIFCAGDHAPETVLALGLARMSRHV